MTTAQVPTIDVGLVRCLVAEQFPEWAHLPVRPVTHQGIDNRTFRLGDALSVRLPSAEHYREQVAKEQHWLPRLARGLPLPIPAPVAVGQPGCGYPWTWSVNRWLDGEPSHVARIDSLVRMAEDVAGFLLALRQLDTDGGPAPGSHNFHRGAAVAAAYGEETEQKLRDLDGRIDTARARAVWEDSLAAAWTGSPVWFHGDVAPGNLLVRDGELSAVIDFGGCGVGDPACDHVLAWTFLDAPARAAFRSTLGSAADDAMWARARGWALWKALITYDSHVARVKAEARRVVDALLGDGD
ncbi:aminoglycoside phosphotransferase family protein [Jiangella asiatica]|uniref:Aminoglycoside phosphotransferase family protein n=1 Tax=Jiangella asiatica TaxID=2530372 RepID=A0A4R5D4I3_9ACTN|nr:aminoglycoside phosphotransferase family protein [Jiangella asiatica]TDE08319.1 aminoglycoside phosphotransferase family protein [Jiangella asiatica]